MPDIVPQVYHELDSCRSLIHFLDKYCGNDTESQDIRHVLLRDLCWRLSRLSVRDRSSVLAQTCYQLLPDEIKKEFGKKEFDLQASLAEIEKGTREKKDVAIVTIIGTEMKAVMRALGREPDDPADVHSEPFNYWFADIQKESGSSLSVVVTMVGASRNVPCAIAIGKLLGRFDVNLLLLVGIAAGIRERTSLGDVVYAERVYDYEHMRLEVRKILRWPTFFRVQRPRPEFWQILPMVKEALERCNWRPIENLFTILTNSLPDLPEGSSKFVPHVHDGTIAAGEKLFVDGSLRRMNKFVDQRILAGDQEDSGFAQAAVFHNVPWCVFRGICDYGDPKKESKWQTAAAISAAAAGLIFLRNVWTGTDKQLMGSDSTGIAPT